MMAGRVAGIDPEAWRIVDGKLFLGFRKSDMDEWDKKPVVALRDSLKKADDHWTELQSQH
jgi:hypothetical protein